MLMTDTSHTEEVVGLCNTSLQCMYGSSGMSRFVENRKKTPTRGPPSTPPRHTYIVHRQDQSAVSLSMIDRWGKVQLINKRYLNVDTVCNTVRGHALRDFSLVGGNARV